MPSRKINVWQTRVSKRLSRFFPSVDRSGFDSRDFGLGVRGGGGACAWGISCKSRRAKRMPSSRLAAQTYKKIAEIPRVEETHCRKKLEGRRLKGHCGRTPALRMLQAAKAHLVTEYHRTSLSLQSHSCFFDPVGLGVWVCDGGPFLLVVCLYGSV